MKFDLTCKEVTRLVLEGEDRRLSLGERLALRWHLLICAACPKFLRQVHFMRRALGHWKQYGEGDSSD